MEGLTTCVFEYTAANIDDTGGYTFLPDVPERYRTLSDGQGTLWIEPETRAAQPTSARTARSRHLALEYRLPAGLFWPGIDLWRRRS